MKDLKTGNYTEFREISDGFHLRLGELNMTNLGFAKVSINQSMTKDLIFIIFFAKGILTHQRALVLWKEKI